MLRYRTRFRCGCFGLASPAAAALFGAWVMRRELACVVGTIIPMHLTRTTSAAAAPFYARVTRAAVTFVGVSQGFRSNRVVGHLSPLPVHTTTAVSTRVTTLYTEGTQPRRRAR